MNGTKTPPAAPSNVWRIVAKREIAVKLRDRNFLISTAVVLVLVVGGLGLQAFLAEKSKNATTTIGVASASAATIVQQSETNAKTAGADAQFRSKNYPDPAAVETAVKDGKVDAGLVPAGQSWRLLGKSSRNTTVATWVGQTIEAQVIARNAQAAGTSIEQLRQGTNISYDVLQPTSKSSSDGSNRGKVSGTVFGILFYLAALLFGMAIANSVVEEKQNRIVEILAAAIPLRQLLIGKVLGNTVLAVAQILLISIAGIIGLSISGNADLLGQLTGGIGWFVLFFLIGFIALACMWAVVGALATRSEDIQSTSMPMTFLVVGVFLVGSFTTGTVQTIASYVPLFSTIAMPVRVVSGSAAWWEPIISLALAVGGAYLIVRFAERMYRASLMQTSKRLSIRSAMRAAAES